MNRVHYGGRRLSIFYFHTNPPEGGWRPVIRALEQSSPFEGVGSKKPGIITQGDVRLNHQSNIA